MPDRLRAAFNPSRLDGYLSNGLSNVIIITKFNIENPDKKQTSKAIFLSISNTISVLLSSQWILN